MYCVPTVEFETSLPPKRQKKMFEMEPNHSVDESKQDSNINPFVMLPQGQEEYSAETSRSSYSSPAEAEIEMVENCITESSTEFWSPDTSVRTYFKLMDLNKRKFRSKRKYIFRWFGARA